MYLHFEATFQRYTSVVGKLHQSTYNDQPIKLQPMFCRISNEETSYKNARKNIIFHSNAVANLRTRHLHTARRITPTHFTYDKMPRLKKKKHLFCL